MLVENLSKGFDLYDLPHSSPSYTFQTPTRKRCIKDGVFVEESTVVACRSNHGKIYVFSLASPDPVQVIKQANKRVEVQAVAVVTVTVGASDIKSAKSKVGQNQRNSKTRYKFRLKLHNY